MTSGYDSLKPSIDFPDPHLAMEEGLIAVGGTLDVPTLYHAYRKGIFPWPQSGYPMLWFSPEKRGIMEFKDFHVPDRLKRQIKNSGLRFAINENFEEVIIQCQTQLRKGQPGTWITPELKEAYVHFHEAGFAHSVEVWREKELVGGIYGVFIEGVFSGESMFHKVSNASKMSLVYLVEHLRSRGLTWMDIQMVTPVVQKMGGKYITRRQFLNKLRAAQEAWDKSRYSF